MFSLKQVIIVNRALNMRKGKIAAQCAHASLKIFLDRRTATMGDGTIWIKATDQMLKWIDDGRYAKICVSVDSEQELLDVYAKAKDAGIVCSLITDAGLTEFNGVPTKTVVAIGPDESEKIDKITGALKLL